MAPWLHRPGWLPLQRSESPPTMRPAQAAAAPVDESTGGERETRATFVRARQTAWMVQDDLGDEEDDFDADKELKSTTSLDKQLGLDNKGAAGLASTLEASSVFQFSTGLYFAEDDEGVVEVDILRIGSTHARAWVEYVTESGSASAGVQFESAKGTVVFNVGEYIKSISVRLHRSEVWQAPLDFAVRLEKSSPDAAINATSHLDRARVWILHVGRYPTDRIDAKSSRIELLREFCRKCLSNDVVRVGTLKTLLVDQLANVVYLWQLWLSVLFVDHVLDAQSAHLDDGASGRTRGRRQRSDPAAVGPAAASTFVFFSWVAASSARLLTTRLTHGGARSRAQASHMATSRRTGAPGTSRSSSVSRTRCPCSRRTGCRSARAGSAWAAPRARRCRWTSCASTCSLPRRAASASGRRGSSRRCTGRRAPSVRRLVCRRPHAPPHAVHVLLAGTATAWRWWTTATWRCSMGCARWARSSQSSSSPPSTRRSPCRCSCCSPCSCGGAWSAARSKGRPHAVWCRGCRC